MNNEIIGISPTNKELKARRKHRTNCCNCRAILKMPEKYSAIVKCDFCGTIQDIEEA